MPDDTAPPADATECGLCDHGLYPKRQSTLTIPCPYCNGTGYVQEVGRGAIAQRDDARRLAKALLRALNRQNKVSGLIPEVLEAVDRANQRVATWERGHIE